MYDTFLSVDSGDETSEEEIILMTWHRQENTESKDRMRSIIRFIRKLEGRIICPMHPRTLKCLKNFGLWEEICSIENLQIIDPVGYLEMISLMKRARLIVTDSGGVSKESSFAGAKCLFMLDLNIWDDLVKNGWIFKVNPEDEASVKKALSFGEKAERVAERERLKFYGDGHAAAKMVDLLEKNLFI